MSTLIAAIEANDLGRVKDALATGSPADEMDDRSGESALAIAAEKASMAVVIALLDAGAHPNDLGTTAWPLQAAIGRGDVAMAERLIEAGADVNAADEDGCSPLSGAATGGHVTIVELLLD